MSALLLSLLLCIPARADDALFRLHAPEPALPSAPDARKKSPGLDGGQADHAGYTTASLDKDVRINWASAVRGDVMEVYARTVDVDYSLAIAIEVSSEYDKGGCPFEATWRHELAHAGAFRSIYTSTRKELLADLRRAAIPTRERPLRLKSSEQDPAKDGVLRKLRAIVDARAKSMSELMEKDRAKKDTPESYARVYESCAAAEWDYRR